MPSKLSVHWQLGGTGLTRTLEAGVAGVKFNGSFPGNEPYGSTRIVGRFLPGEDHLAWQHGLGNGNPVEAAQYFFNLIWSSVAANSFVYYVESPNEPIVRNEMEMRWLADFLYEFAKLCHAAGRRAVIGNFSVGNPHPSLWAFFGKALQACLDFGAIIGVHLYGPLTEDYALRHRVNNRSFNELGYFNIPQIATEAGAEEVAGMMPWKAQYGGNFTRYRDEWLVPFAHEIHKDPYLLFAAIFTQGTGGGSGGRWSLYDIADVADEWVATIAHLSATYPTIKGPAVPFYRKTVPVPPPPPPPPVSTDFLKEWTHTVILEGELPVRERPWRDGPAPRAVMSLTKGSRVNAVQVDGDWGRIGFMQWVRLKEGVNTKRR